MPYYFLAFFNLEVILVIEDGTHFNSIFSLIYLPAVVTFREKNLIFSKGTKKGHFRAKILHLTEESIMHEKCSGCLQLFLILHKTTSTLHLDLELFCIMNTLKIPLDTFKKKALVLFLVAF